MRSVLRALLGAMVFAAVPVTVAPVAHAADSPVKFTRPARIIVPYVQGGGSDALSRMLAPFLAEDFGQQVLVENRAGGSSTIGTQMVARAAPDGHTIGMIDAAFTTNPALFAKLPYDTLRDFEPVVFIASAPLALLVHPSVPAQNVAELVALARAKPGTLTFGSAGNGTGIHLAGEQLRIAAGVDMTHVPYKGAGQAITELLGGQITMAFTTPLVARPHSQAGKARALAISGAKRSASMPDLVTFAEAGYPSVDAVTINGFLLPAGTTPEIVQRVNAATRRALALPEMQVKLRELGFEVAGGTPQEFGAFLRSEIAKWEKVIKAAGLKVEQ